jgi:hypothetical protein
MATRKSILLKNLALAREKRAANIKRAKEPIKAPEPERENPPNLGIISNPGRELAAKVTERAMIAGWDRAIQDSAYENRVSEDRIRQLLDEALEYQDKADPSGRIEGLEDWKVEKQGSSELAARQRA